MRHAIQFNSSQRRTKTTDGVLTITMITTNGVTELREIIGTIVRPLGSDNYIPTTLDGKALEECATRNLAAGILKRQFQSADTVEVSLTKAADVLIGNPVQALQHRIEQGLVDTVKVKGKIRVVINKAQVARADQELLAKTG